MIYTTNIFAVPLVMLIWAIDVGLLVAPLRLIIGHLPATRSSVLAKALGELVDPILQRVDRSLAVRRYWPSPPWLSWVIVIGVGLVARHFLVLTLVSISQTQT